MRPRAKRPLESRICRKSRAADPHMCSRLSNERSNQLGNSLGHCLGNRYGKQTCQSCPTQRPHTDASCSCLTPLPHEGAPHSCVTGAQSNFSNALAFFRRGGILAMRAGGGGVGRHGGGLFDCGPFSATSRRAARTPPDIKPTCRGRRRPARTRHRTT